MHEHIWLLSTTPWRRKKLGIITLRLAVLSYGLLLDKQEVVIDRWSLKANVINIPWLKCGLKSMPTSIPCLGIHSVLFIHHQDVRVSSSPVGDSLHNFWCSFCQKWFCWHFLCGKSTSKHLWSWKWRSLPEKLHWRFNVQQLHLHLY